MNPLRRFLETDDEGRAALRTLGGLLLALGLVVALIRRTSFPDPWGEGAQFLVAFAAFAFLYGTGLLGALVEGRARPWQAVYMISGVLLLPLALYLFVVWVGDPLDTAEPLNSVWIFLATAVAAAVAALAGRARYGFLLAGLAFIGAWLALWEEILADGLAGDYGTLRGLLMLVMAILLAAAAALYLLDRGRDLGHERASELVTAAAIAAITGAGFISLVSAGGATSTIGGVPAAPEPSPYGQASLFWDLVLLGASLLAISAAARFGNRGLGYVGAIGLLTFAGVVGADLDDDSPAGSVAGWPLALLIVGAAAFLASLHPTLTGKSPARDGDTPAGPPPSSPPPG